MIPCKNCDDKKGTLGYNIKVEYGWFYGLSKRYNVTDSYGYSCRCLQCGTFSNGAPTIKGAWENWETENEINHNITEE